MTSGGGDHVKRTGSKEEWFVRVNDSCLDTPTAQSPNLTWFSLDAAEMKVTNVARDSVTIKHKIHPRKRTNGSCMWDQFL